MRAALLLFAAAVSPLTHESMWMMKRVGPPVASPDGRWVVFSLTEPAYDEKDQVSDLWIVLADANAAPRRITYTKGAETGAAWSPDGRRLAFTARREGDDTSQVYILDLAAGGEAIRVTDLSTGASSPRWSPDGQALLFTSNVYPGAGDDETNKKAAAERKARKYRARVYTGFPVRHWDHWLDDRHAHPFVQALDPAGPARDLLAGTKLAAQPGFGGALSESGGENLNAIWTPDGKSVVFSAATNRDAAAYAFVQTHLFQAPVSGGEPRQITSGEGSCGRPVFHPSGSALYFLHEPRTDKVYNLPRLSMMPWPGGGERQTVTRNFDRGVGAFDFSSDGKLIYLLSEYAGHESIHAVPATGGEVRMVLEAKTGVFTNLNVPEKAASTVLIANWESAVNPAEVVRIDPASGRRVALTNFNGERAAAVDWQPLREFWFTSKRGKKIHNLLALPPGFDEGRKYPLVALIHGGPHSMWRDQFFLRWNYHLIAQPGYVVLLTNFTGSTGFSEKFAQEIQGDPLAGPGDEVNEAVDDAVRRFPFIDGSRMAAGGASYGGHLANWLEATTTRYKCLFSHAGLVNLESQWGTSDTIYSREMNMGGPHWEGGKGWREQNPIKYAGKFRTPMLLTVGERDFRVPLNQTLENWSALQRMRVPSRLVVFEEANHWIQRGEDSRFFYQELLGWLRQHLGP